MWHSYMAVYGYNYCVRVSIENQIDGIALLALLGDFTEFQHVVPQSAYRMRLKSVVERLCYHYTTTESMVSVNIIQDNCEFIFYLYAVIDFFE